MKKKQQIVLKTQKKSLSGIHESIVSLLKSHSSISGEGLQEVIDYYNSVVLSMPGNVFWMDRECRTVGCNQNVLDMFGLASPEDFYGLSFEEMAELGHWTQNQSDSFKRDTLEVIESGLPKANVEEPPIPGADGKDIYFLTTRVPLLNKDKKVIGIVGISTDITDRKRMEIELEQAKEAAESASQAKSEFLANMSHDIRTPLTGMIGLADEMIEADLSPDQVTEYARELSSASNRLLNLLNEVLDISRIEQGHFLGEAMLFSPRRMIQDIVDLLSPSINNKGLSFFLEYDESIPLSLIGPRILLHRILLNMLSNAIKFTEQGSIRLLINLIQQDEEYAVLKFQIEDTGIGMSEAQQRGIFEPFTRGTASYKGGYQGTGLGLHIVKQFLEAMDGSVKVTSQEGKGSVFSCDVPLRIPTAAEQAVIYSSEESDFSVSGQSDLELVGSVLLIEDDSLAQKVTLMKLKKIHRHVDVVSTGEAALQSLKENHYDLVYLDIGLPDIEGYVVAEQFREWERQQTKVETPLLALTAHVNEEYKERCLVSGVTAVLHKPLTRELAESMCDQYVRDSNLVESSESELSQLGKREEAAIDLNLGAELVGSEAAVREVLAILAEELPGTKQSAEAAYEQGDWVVLKDAVHKLHGGACYTGTPRLKEAAAALERELEGGKQPSEASYNKLLREMDAFLMAYQSLFNMT